MQNDAKHHPRFEYHDFSELEQHQWLRHVFLWSICHCEVDWPLYIIPDWVTILNIRWGLFQRDVTRSLSYTIRYHSPWEEHPEENRINSAEGERRNLALGGYYYNTQANHVLPPRSLNCLYSEYLESQYIRWPTSLSTASSIFPRRWNAALPERVEWSSSIHERSADQAIS